MLLRRYKGDGIILCCRHACMCEQCLSIVMSPERGGDALCIICRARIDNYEVYLLLPLTLNIFRRFPTFYRSICFFIIFVFLSARILIMSVLSCTRKKTKKSTQERLTTGFICRSGTTVARMMQPVLFYSPIMCHFTVRRQVKCNQKIGYP